MTEACAALAREPGLAALNELSGDLGAMAGDSARTSTASSAPPGRV